MTRRAGLLLLLALPGLFLYLWPALSAPVVLWSDSALDLEWARKGVGIVSPVPPAPVGADQPAHPAKPAYLLFLRAVMAAAPDGSEERAIVVVQSLLLWLSIAGTSLFVARRRGLVGFVLAVVLFLVLRVRDSASVVLPEALAAAVLLPIAAVAIVGPLRSRVTFLLGSATAFLFWIRPNVGAVALLLTGLAISLSSRWKATTAFMAGFTVLFAPIWIATRPSDGGETLRGLAHPIFFGSADYYWHPSSSRATESSPASLERRELADASRNWRAFLRRAGPDARRQLLWRALHGILGTEFYDARWSSSYRAWTVASRLATPFLILLAAAVFLGGLVGSESRVLAAIGLLLLFLLVVQNFVLGSEPRFVLPFLPVLCLFAFTIVRMWPIPGRNLLVTGSVFALLSVLVATSPFVLDWQWGRIESAGVRIRQQVPKGALPPQEPATLHVRIASPVLPSSAHFMVLAPDGTVLYTSENDTARGEPAITTPLPQSLLDASAAGPLEVTLLTFGSYGELDYVLFPVIPRPWRTRALREESKALSPSTGIRGGAFDWWAHSGFDRVEPPRLVTTAPNETAFAPRHSGLRPSIGADH